MRTLVAFVRSPVKEDLDIYPAIECAPKCIAVVSCGMSLSKARRNNDSQDGNVAFLN